VSWISSHRTSALVLGVAGLLFLFAMWGFYTSDGAVAARERDARLEDAMKGGTAREDSPIEVEVVLANEDASIEIVELAGVLEPLRSTWVAAEIAGSVVDVPVEEYARVEKGTLLLQLDPALPEAEAIRARALHSLAVDELERQKRLGSRSVASKAELDRAIAEERRAYASLLEARTRLSHTRITAPFDGLVNSLELDPGAYVQPGTQIAQVLDISKIELTVLVGDRQISALAPGAAARVRVDPLGNETVEGRIVRVGGAPQETSQRYPVVVGLDNPEGRLLPGMLAHVQFEIGSRRAIRIPARAVVREFELDYVFTIETDDRVRRARVTTRPVAFRPDRVEITDGIEVGARIVVSNVGQLSNATRVVVR